MQTADYDYTRLLYCGCFPVAESSTSSDVSARISTSCRRFVGLHCTETLICRLRNSCAPGFTVSWKQYHCTLLLYIPPEPVRTTLASLVWVPPSLLLDHEAPENHSYYRLLQQHQRRHLFLADGYMLVINGAATFFILLHVPKRVRLPWILRRHHTFKPHGIPACHAGTLVVRWCQGLGIHRPAAADRDEGG